MIIECTTPSITTGRPLDVRIYRISWLRRLCLMPYLRGQIYSQRITNGGWKWRWQWFRKGNLQGYDGGITK